MTELATIATISMPPSLQALVSEALATWMPRATVLVMTRPEIVDNDAVGGVIVAPAEDDRPALAELRLLRTEGYRGPVVLLAAAGADGGADDDTELARLGGRRCGLGDGFAERLATMAGGMGPSSGAEGEGSDPLTTVLHDELDETRRLLAFAEVARRLPHALNNPLAALLAEAQLLELEELEPEQREATERIVGLARRVIGLVRELQLAQPRR